MNWLANLAPLIGIMLIIAGVPGFAILYNTTQDLTTSLILLGLYELLVIVGGIFTKVWQRLEGKWIERMADQLDLILQSFFSGYQKKYFEYVVYQHRVFDVKGLTTQGPYNLELEKVYVELSVDPTPLPMKKGNTNPIQNLPEELRSGTHTIWEYVNSKGSNGHNYAILGAPGSGKTTLVKFIALSLAAPAHRRRKMGIPSVLPVLLFLRDHVTEIVANPNAALAPLLQEQFKRREAPIPPTGWLEKQLQDGKCLIMLDGLDEVADPENRRKMVAWVEEKMKAHGKNRFLLTSRPHGYQSNPMEGVTVLQVRPFSTKQVEKFAHNWYLANEIMSSQKDDPGVREAARSGANDLLQRIRSNSSLSDLTVNPLLLTMIATVHRYRSSLPGRRVELYAEIAEVFLGKRQQARGVQLNLTPAQKIRVLRELAYEMMVRETREIATVSAVTTVIEPLSSVSPKTKPDEFLTDVENSSGLLVEMESGKYSFSHLTFQEYLASLHIIETQQTAILVEKVGQSWWHETIRLYCAQADASPIVSACLEKLTPQTLSLAMECLEEAREVSASVRGQFETTLDEALESDHPEIQKLAASALLVNRTT
ncbi:MAG: NACHT domain-containing protein [Anaerolineales bacterium]|jgi:predicted NACHT family NTPase|nr:NACHT domain-containing protein [Anaerolineales bacterium]